MVTNLGFRLQGSVFNVYSSEANKVVVEFWCPNMYRVEFEGCF